MSRNFKTTQFVTVPIDEVMQNSIFTQAPLCQKLAHALERWRKKPQVARDVKPLLCIPSHFLPLQKPSWESHRDFHHLRKSQGIPREKVCGYSHCPLASHLSGDTSAVGTPDLPSMQPWGAHIRRPTPSLLPSTEYS